MSFEDGIYEDSAELNISQEIWKPISTILDLIDQILKTLLTLNQRNMLNQIQLRANDLLGIVNNLQDFSKIEAGKIRIENKTFNLLKVLEDLSDVFYKSVAEKGIELIVSIDENIPYQLLGDSLRLKQILIHLISNAIKFTDSGEIVVRVVMVVKVSDRIGLRFSVTDTGKGISRKNISKLFSYYVHSDTEPIGAGLGLAICKQLAEMMGGEIWVESIKGEGSAFYFTAEFGLQIKEGELKSVSPPVDLKGLKVLIIDDNSTFQDVAHDMLKSFTFEPEGADTEDAALAKLNEAKVRGGKYDLILIDLTIPKMEITDTVRRIRQLFDIPIIIMASYGLENVIQQAKEVGVIDFVTKPIKQTVLFDTIVDVISKKATDALTQDQMATNESDAMKRLMGARILIAEDAYVNQQLIKKILEKFGAIVEIANNGKEAVDIITSFHFDVILMDIQMPLMDGYTASKLIRQFEISRFKDNKNIFNSNFQVPIIALTGQTGKNDRDQCFEAGMNDYIIKPIDTEKLFFVLAKWIKYREKNIEEKDKILSIEHDLDCDLPEIISGIDIPAGIKRLGGNKKLFKKLLIEFYIEYANTSQEIKNAIEQEDSNLAIRLAHTFKGVAGNLSATKLYHTTNELETIIKENQVEDYERILNSFESSLNEVIGALKQFVQEEHKLFLEKKHPSDVSKVKEILLKIDTCLNENNLDADEYLTELKENLASYNFREEINLLEKYVRNLDFESAKPIISDINRKLMLKEN
ncbi:MAG: response regulator [Desulfobacterales bacterium]|nr:response regulator [Desulfobacterales bacterium]